MLQQGIEEIWKRLAERIVVAVLEVPKGIQKYTSSELQRI
jgi:hypothetical protein